IRRVVLTDGPPLALRKIGAPPLPVLRAAGLLGETMGLRALGLVVLPARGHGFPSLRTFDAGARTSVSERRRETATSYSGSSESGASTWSWSRMSSPSDHAWKGHPRGLWGGSPSAISGRWPRPDSSR